MSQASQSDATLSDGELQLFVSQALAERRLQFGPVASVHRHPFVYASSYALEAVVVRFEDKRELRLIFKNLSLESMEEQAQRVRPSASHRPHCEISMYSEVLSKARLGCAFCYGALIDDERNRYGLLLEQVEGDDLGKIGDFSIWQSAANWLAMAHRRLPHVVQDSGTKHIYDYNETCFHQWIDHAQQVTESSGQWNSAELSTTDVTFLVTQARRAALVVNRLPKTVIHGEYYASNILASRHDGQLRICPVDWETAGFGCGLLDVATLVAGKWSEEEKDRLTETYLTAMEHDGKTAPELPDVSTALCCCRLLMAMKWIGRARHWQAPVEHRCDWIAEALGMAEVIHRERRDVS